MDVVICPSSPLLGKRIAELLEAKIAAVQYKKFPDGELYVRVESEEDSHIVVGSLCSNDDIIVLNLLFDAIKGEITALIPYMGYARQDREFLKGEAVSIRAIAKMIEERAEKIVTVNIHSNKAKENFKKLIDVDAMPKIGEHFRGRDIVMISPDKGSAERVKIAANVANCEWDWLEKKRIDAHTVEIAPKNLNVEGRNVLIVDDIISTGGTVVEATKKLYELGAKRVEAACVHAVLADFASIKLFSNGIADITATDTIERIFSKISVAGILAETL
ncbi:MAG: ribose-phosphate diphosphokinase [Archaeoglobi archaeon]|jgi:ribose-phosphate pyrophosphokinase|nr:ribose-phosphate diphosphokinase [Archaeoglobi archaeon]TDA29686.1 MAG: ribose-phosphate diphosphokinase [Archaeoglobi archaeon]